MIIFFKICFISFFSFPIFFFIKKFFNYFNNNCYNSNKNKKQLEFNIIEENEMINIRQHERIPFLNTNYPIPPPPLSPLTPLPPPPPEDSASTPIMRHYYNADYFEDYDSCA